MTSKREGSHGNLSCSFCGKGQKEFKKLIAGPSVYICDACIALCNDILAEEVQKEERAQSDGKLPRPKEIKAILDDCKSSTQAIGLAVKWGDAKITRHQLEESLEENEHGLKEELEEAVRRELQGGSENK